MTVSGHKAVSALVAVIVLCAALPAGATQFTANMTIRGTDRNYIVYVPDSYDGSTPYPLLFMFHGLTGTSTNAASVYYDWQPVADSNKFIVLFPDSLAGFPEIWPGVPGSDKYWDINPNSIDSQDLDFVTGMIAWAAANYNIRTSHVFTTGHSYGAFFSFYTAVQLSDRITAFGEHSGGAYSAGWPNFVPAGGHLKGILLHSPGDSIVTNSLSLYLHSAMLANGHVAKFIELPEWMDHTWDKSRNQEQWDFFMANAPVIDDDADGMPDRWETDHGLNTSSNDAVIDTDHDGANNYAEYVADTHPTNGLDVFRISAVSTTDTVVAWQSSTGRLYSLFYTTSLLGTGTWAAVTGWESVRGTAATMRYTNTSSSPQMFYRASAAVTE